MDIKREMYSLLKDWCDGLLRYQINEIEDKEIKGGILCPACSIIHGRCYCAVPALLYVGKKERDPKYIRSAEALIVWSDHITWPDGSFENDTMSNWRGITTFAVIALSDAYFKYGTLLRPGIRQKLLSKIEHALHYLTTDYKPHGNVNYLMATAYALEKSGVYFNNSGYREIAANYFTEFKRYITDSGFIYGEGVPNWTKLSPKGCRPIDVGYSVEEILNHMVLYALSTEDGESLKLAQKIAETYLVFALPDGGWDNSFGTRMDKWTYWGSRTSDGCQPAFFILGEKNPALAQAAYRNMLCLRKSTHHNMLYGGLGLYRHGEPPCAHHAFTHVDGLAVTLEWMDNRETPINLLTETDIRCESRYLKELDTYIMHSNGFRATITAYDIVQPKPNSHPTGGALSLLYHEKAGLLSAASMSIYTRYELYNTQMNRDDQDHPFTPRLEWRNADSLYASMLDSTAKITACSQNRYEVNGKITDANGGEPFEQSVSYQWIYQFEQNACTFYLKHNDAKRRLDFFFPVILQEGDTIEGTQIKKANCVLEISASESLEWDEKPIFNHVPGFEAINYYIKNVPEELEFNIKIKEQA